MDRAGFTPPVFMDPDQVRDDEAWMTVRARGIVFILRQGGFVIKSLAPMSGAAGGIFGFANSRFEFDAMSRFLTLIMIFVLVLAHGSSVAAAICRHQDGVAHVAALQSEDAGIAAAAYGEETAGKSSSRKGVPADAGSVSSPSDMLPTPGLQPPLRAREPAELSPAEAPMLAGASIRPLLEPPSA